MARKHPDLAANPAPATRARLVNFAHLYRGGPDEVRGNAVACYRMVHPAASVATAQAKACLYYNHPIVQAILDEKAQELCEQADITQERVLQELAKLAFFNVQALFNDDGTPKAISELDEHTAAAIAGVDVATIGNKDVGLGTILKMKLADKKGALELLGKNLKMWTDKVEASVNGGQSIADLAKAAWNESE